MFGGIGYNIIRVVYQGVDRVSPVLNQIRGSSQATNDAIIGGTDRAGKSVSHFHRQIQALQTTLRYGLAGVVTYKIFQGFQNLAQYESTLGRLNVQLQQTNPSLFKTAGALDAIGAAAIRVSTQTAQPLQDVLASIQNILSTFPGISQNAALALASIEAKTATITGGQPAVIGAAVSQIASTVYGRGAIVGKGGEGRLAGVAAGLIQTLFTTPGTSAQALTSYLPQLLGGAATAGFTGGKGLAQVLALFTVAQRTLGRPAQTAQYLRQLLIRLSGKGPTKAEAPFFAQAGLTPKVLASQTGFQSLMQLLEYVSKQVGGVSAADLKDILAGNAPGKLINLQGNARIFLGQIIGGRIQSLIAATALARGLGQIPVEYKNQLNAQINGLKELNKELDAALSRQKMQQFGIAFSDMTTKMLASLYPVIKVLSQFGLKAVGWESSAQDFLSRNLKHAGLGSSVADPLSLAILAATGYLGVKGTGKGLGKLSGILKKYGRFGKAGAGALGAIPSAAEMLYAAPLNTAAISSALLMRANGTPEAPFWVVIHPLSKSIIAGAVQQGMPPSGGKSGESTTSTVAKDIAKFGGGAAAARVGLGLLGGAAGTGALVMTLGGDQPFAGYPGSGFPLLDKIAHDQNFGPNSGRRGAIWTAYLRGKISRALAERQLEALASRATHPALLTGGFMGSSGAAQWELIVTSMLQASPELKKWIANQEKQKHTVHVNPTKLGNISSTPPTSRGTRVGVSRHR